MRAEMTRRIIMARLIVVLIALTAVLTMSALATCGSSSSSTAEENKEVVSRFIEEFKNNANHDIVDELFVADFVHHLTDPSLPPGAPAYKLLGQSIVAGFPDVQATVEDLLAEGDKVIEQSTARATHTGEFNGIPPTGNQVVWTEIHIYRLSEGKIAELWSEIDLLGLLVQLGAIPSA